jgi:hypothetical protein
MKVKLIYLKKIVRDHAEDLNVDSCVRRPQIWLNRWRSEVQWRRWQWEQSARSIEEKDRNMYNKELDVWIRMMNDPYT